mgnify:CR=1 FL=1
MNEFDSQVEIVRIFAHIEGRNQERERIIKLLEAECCELDVCKCQMTIEWAIALIKGENK